nr:hypothetical protein [Angustibacter aerolatus]
MIDVQHPARARRGRRGDRVRQDEGEHPVDPARRHVPHGHLGDRAGLHHPDHDLHRAGWARPSRSRSSSRSCSTSPCA